MTDPLLTPKEIRDVMDNNLRANRILHYDFVEAGAKAQLAKVRPDG